MQNHLTNRALGSRIKFLSKTNSRNSARLAVFFIAISPMLFAVCSRLQTAYPSYGGVW
nr:MAG TPA: hypothetical protein [Caudoviricetes sp.]DAR90828.1 MAG TPA: hypothetical protein [Caudoviricetes sp.]